MKKLFEFLLAGAALTLAVGSPALSAAKRIAVSIDASKTAPPISPYMYGQFIEHIGDLINKSVWAEMLDDRKFYNDVTSKPPVQAGRGGGRGAGGPGRGGRPPARWLPIGPDDAVTMDRQNPYVGVHTPLIHLAGGASRGISQAGLALHKGKVYAGRVVIAAAPGAKVSVNLVWGESPGNRQTIPLTAVKSSYTKFPLNFTAGADTANGRLEISATGQGSFHVGAVSLMPADNIHGFRPDTIALLKAQRSGMWRFPGGNYLSAFEWRDAIGDPDKRAPRPDVVRGGFQPNDVGTDEFMTLMGLLGVDPFVSVNAGFGDAFSAGQLVEYANGAATTPMGKLRAANGHPAPYNIKWWGIGNEMYGSWQYGHMAMSQYVFKHNMFAEAMRKVDPSITLLATGATPDEMTIYGLALPTVGKLIPDFLSPGDWDGGLFTHCFDAIDVMSEHFYSYAGQRFDASATKPGAFSRADYMVRVEEPLVEWARRPANRVREKVEAYDEYLQRIPALKTRRIPMVIDEWAYSGAPNSLRGVVANAMVLQEMFRHTDLIKMAGHTMGTSSIEYNSTESALNSTGLFFKFYRDHFGSIPVEVGGDSPVPAPLYPVGGDQPKVNAGSPTYPVDVVAALTADGKVLTVAIINANESAQDLDLTVKGIAPGKGRMWRMTGDSLTASAGIGRNEIRITETALSEAPKSVTIAPFSIDIYELEKR